MCASKPDKKRRLFSFTPSEQKGILLLIPLLAVICIIFIGLNKPKEDPVFTAYSNQIIENTKDSGIPTDYPAGIRSTNPSVASGRRAANSQDHELFEFDPNTIDREGLERLGFSARQTATIINYRNAGAVFRKPEDFARCYSVSDEKFDELRPYIRIAEAPQTTGPADDAYENDITENPSLTVPTSSNGSRSSRDRDSYSALDDTYLSNLIDLNSADSATLVTVRGIGALTAGRIVQYRRMLGGYADVSQLKEIVGMTDQNYAMIIQQIFVDTVGIKKIDINFASPESMKGHPYISSRTLDKILKHRQLKGGWSTTEELIEDNILTEKEAARLIPYLYFSE